MPTPKIETVQPAAAATSYVIPENSTKKETVKSDPPASSLNKHTNKRDSSPGTTANAVTSAASAEEYQAINDRLNRIEKLISDLMTKVDDKTRSIEKSVAKVKSHSSKSKHVKPQSVTICVDSPSAAGAKDGNNCDEQFL